MTATIHITCPGCKKQGFMRVDPKRTGKIKVNCPNCGTKFEHTIDRRSYYRRSPLPLIRFGRLDFDFRDLSHRGELMDISATGCRIRVAEDPPRKGDQLGLYFRLPSAEPPAGLGGQTPSFDSSMNESLSLDHNPDVRVGGEVVWVRKSTDAGYEFGVRFIFEEEHAKKTIGFYLFPYHEPLERK
ncbi:MAG: PilZ domain-containing protein [Deltaproteobacteria bacterium]|nr:PilZ domain-containing protein [Deltaproteobacteria bacterium]